MWPDWAIYWTLGNILKPLATINLPKSSSFLGNFCKGLKYIIFLVKSYLSNFYRHLIIFIWSHWPQGQFGSSSHYTNELPTITITHHQPVLISSIYFLTSLLTFCLTPKFLGEDKAKIMTSSLSQKLSEWTEDFSLFFPPKHSSLGRRV